MSGTALITGGSSGIGLALAERFAAAGYQVVLVARRRNELATIAKRLMATHHITVHTIVSDLADPDQPAEVAAKLARAKFTVDVLVNNAGFGLLGPFAEADEAVTIGMVQVNVHALTELTRLLLPGMLKRKTGRILNVASTAAFQPGPFVAVYYATKAYVLSFSEALHEELRGSGVTVTCVAPGPTKTGFQDRALIQNVALFSVGVMSVNAVADAAYKATMRGQRLVIPGLRNYLGAWLIRFAPRALVLRFVRRLQEPQA